MDEQNKVAEDKRVAEDKKNQIADVKAVIDARKVGGPDNIGEAEEDRARRERVGRQMRGEHQDAPVATVPVEPSVKVLEEHKASLETEETAGDLEAAKARQVVEESAGNVQPVLDSKKEVPTAPKVGSVPPKSAFVK